MQHITTNTQDDQTNVTKLLDDLKTKVATITPAPTALTNIKKIKEICDKEYNAKMSFGADSLNRKILLDKRIADLLTKETVIAIFAMRYQLKGNVSPENPIAIRRDSEYTTLADAIYYGFSGGMEAIKFMPNNKKDNPDADHLKDYQIQKANYEVNTKKILSTIKETAGSLGIPNVDAAYINPIVKKYHLTQQFESIVSSIEKIKNDNKSSELLYVPGFTTDRIRNQVRPGFSRLCDIIGAEITNSVEDDIMVIRINKPSSIEDFSKSFINSNKALLDNLVSHQFYDIRHFQAAIEQNTLIMIGSKKYQFKDLLHEMIKQCESKPGSVAYEQFHIRLSLMQNDLKNRFPDYVASHQMKDTTSVLMQKMPVNLNAHSNFSEHVVSMEMAASLYQAATLKEGKDPFVGLDNKHRPEKFSKALEILGIETSDVKFIKPSGYKIIAIEDEFQKITNFHENKELIVTKGMASALYKAVTDLGRGHEINNLKNDPKPEKFSKALEILGIETSDVKFIKPSGYKIKTNFSNVEKINKISNLEIKSTNEQKLSSLSKK